MRRKMFDTSFFIINWIHTSLFNTLPQLLKELTPYMINYTIKCILVWSTDITYFPKYKKNNIKR